MFLFAGCTEWLNTRGTYRHRLGWNYNNAAGIRLLWTLRYYVNPSYMVDPSKLCFTDPSDKIYIKPTSGIVNKILHWSFYLDLGVKKSSIYICRYPTSWTEQVLRRPHPPPHVNVLCIHDLWVIQLANPCEDLPIYIDGLIVCNQYSNRQTRFNTVTGLYSCIFGGWRASNKSMIS